MNVLETTDEAAIATAAQRFFEAVDRGDWALARTLMRDPFEIDYSSYGGGPAALRDPEAILADWRAFLPGFDHTHHQIGALSIERAGERATAGAHVTASHFLDDGAGAPLWTVFGRYRIGFAREAAGWVLAALRFDFQFQSGAQDMPARARRRVERR